MPVAKPYNRHAMTLSRRDLLRALPSIALLPTALTGQAPRQLRARGLHSMTLAVSDVKRSLEFYQGLFGMPIQARQGDGPLLRVGPGPKFMALAPAGTDRRPGVSRFGIAVENFDADRIVAILAEHGVTRATGSDPAMAGPMKVLLSTREKTPELFVSDPSGVVFQLYDPTYCGGSGPLGAACGGVQQSPAKGMIAVED